MVASSILQIIGLNLLLLFVCASSPLLGAGDEGLIKTGESLNVPLFLYKAAFAPDERPYLHVTPESIILYFRGLELKRLPVTSLDYCHQHPLGKSRILTWNPQPGGPVVIIEGEADEALLERMSERLALDQVPTTFSLVLDDGAILVVTPDESLRRKFRRALSVKKEAESSPVLFIQMPAAAARQLFWHLQEEMGVIY